jgi:hypothetical protein
MLLTQASRASGIVVLADVGSPSVAAINASWEGKSEVISVPGMVRKQGDTPLLSLSPRRGEAPTLIS